MPRPAFIDDKVLLMALVGYEQEKAKLEAAIANVRAQLGVTGSGHSSAASDGLGVVPLKRRTMSRAAKKRIADAQRKRWELARKQKAEAAKPTEKPKRKLSKAGRAAIVAATKARWQRVHEAQKAAPKTTALKKTARKESKKAA